MRVRSVGPVVVCLLSAACSTSGSPIAGSPATGGASTGATEATPAVVATDAGQVGAPSVPPEFDLASVPLMELETDVPVPVPAGGEVDTEHGFTGSGVVVLYPSVDQFETFAAFYDAWFASQGITAFRMAQSSTDLAETWDATVDGTVVRIFMYEPDTGPSLTLEVTWS